jgi:uncharacterized membrane protein
MRKKTLKIAYWIVTVLFVLFMLFGAVSELLQAQSAQQVLTDLGYPVYLNYILGIAKVIGAIAIVQWTFTALKEWAYAGFTIDIVGAAASAYFAGQGVGAALFTLVFLIPLFLSYWLWKKTDANA